MTAVDWTFEVAAEVLASGPLPPDFTDWTLADEDGVTIAHVAALHNHLPDGFQGWDIAMENGHTVAYVASAALSGCLPDNFKAGDLATMSVVARK